MSTTDLLTFLEVARRCGLGARAQSRLLQVDLYVYQETLLRLRWDTLPERSQERLRIATGILTHISAASHDERRAAYSLICPLCGPVLQSRTILDLMCEGTIEDMRWLRAQLVAES